MIVGTEGDVGDAVYALGVMQHIPDGPHTLLFQPSSVTKTGTDPSKLCDVVAPLARKQNYIREARCVQPGEHVDWHSGQFRGFGQWCPKVSLLGAKAYHLQATKRIGGNITGKERWLFSVDPSPLTQDRVVINRTGRYRNGYFPWNEIVNFYGDRLIFVGLPHEYRDFCGEFGMVEFRRTSNMLEVAELIAGSLLFIGNQSSANAVAEGLKHNLIQETSLQIPDCIFKRGNAQHVYDGSCVLPGFGEPDRHVGTKFKPRININESIVPPGFWQFEDFTPQMLPSIMVDLVHAKRGGDKAEIKKEILQYNVNRMPEYFSDQSSTGIFQIFKEANKNAVS